MAEVIASLVGGAAVGGLAGTELRKRSEQSDFREIFVAVCEAGGFAPDMILFFKTCPWSELVTYINNYLDLAITAITETITPGALVIVEAVKTFLIQDIE
mgnify:CR=1 FL=1